MGGEGGVGWEGKGRLKKGITEETVEGQMVESWVQNKNEKDCY